MSVYTKQRITGMEWWIIKMMMTFPMKIWNSLFLLEDLDNPEHLLTPDTVQPRLKRLLSPRRPIQKYESFCGIKESKSPRLAQVSSSFFFFIYCIYSLFVNSWPAFCTSRDVLLFCHLKCHYTLFLCWFASHKWIRYLPNVSKVLYVFNQRTPAPWRWCVRRCSVEASLSETRLHVQTYSTIKRIRLPHTRINFQVYSITSAQGQRVITVGHQTTSTGSLADRR